MRLLSSAEFFKISCFKKNFHKLIRVSNGLDPDQDPHSVGSDLGSNYLQRLPAKTAASMERVKNHFVYHSFSLPGTDIKGIMKDLSGGDLTSIGGSWSSFLVDNLLERSGAAQFMKPQQCDRESDKYFPAVNGWKSGKIQF